MVLGLIGVIAAFAGAPGPAQQVADLEWRREPPSAFAGFATDPDPAVRARAARALGRLQNSDSGPALRALADDPDPRVRLEVAFALGITPGAAPMIRDWLDRLPASPSWGARPPADDVRAALLESLGRVGGPEDVQRLTSALAQPGPPGVAAAHALARFGRKGIVGTGDAIPALVVMTGNLDPRRVEAAAYGLRRITMKAASVADVERAAARAGTAPTGPARAWLVNAAWTPSGVEGRRKLFSAAMSDTTPLVRIAALDQVKTGDVDAASIAPGLHDTDEGVRAAAVAALGRAATPAARELLAHHDARPFQEADLERARLAAAGDENPATYLDRARDTSVDPQVRAAIIEALRDVPALLTLCADAATVVRSAAASVLVEEKLPVSEKDALALLGSNDLVVRQAAIDRLQALEPREAQPSPPAPPRGSKKILPPPATRLSRDAAGTVLAALRVDTDPDVLATGFDLLAAHLLRWKGDIDIRDGLLRDTLIRGLGHPDAPVREAAARLQRATGVTIGDVPRRNDIPFTDVPQTRSIVGATVTTDRGAFTIELLPDIAPLAVANFARLGQSHFYDKLVFHRVVPGFVIQTGDPRGDGSGGPNYTIPDEVSPLDYRHGAVGMARSGPDTGGSQWFVTTSNQPHLTGDYTLFGYVTAGMTVVDAIERGDRILSVTIDRIEREP